MTLAAIAFISWLMNWQRLEVFKMLLGSFFPLAILILAVLWAAFFLWPFLQRTAFEPLSFPVVTNVDAADGSFVVQFLNHGNLGDTSIPSSQPSNAPTSIRANGSDSPDRSRTGQRIDGRRSKRRPRS